MLGRLRDAGQRGDGVVRVPPQPYGAGAVELGRLGQGHLDQAGDLWPVKADLHQFEQVIINLAVNARDAMPDGGKLVIRTANIGEKESRELGRKEFPAGEYVLIEVRDTGTGMSEEVKVKIFEPFFSTKEGGTGLGLALTHQIVAEHGGRIEVASRAGRGTTFTLKLPAAA